MLLFYASIGGSVTPKCMHIYDPAITIVEFSGNELHTFDLVFNNYVNRELLIATLILRGIC